MSAQGGAGSQAPISLRTTSALDYGWWASDGPTAGYLIRRAIDSLKQSPDAGRRQVRHAHLQVLRLAAADAIDISVSAPAGRTASAGSLSRSDKVASSPWPRSRSARVLVTAG